MVILIRMEQPIEKITTIHAELLTISEAATYLRVTTRTVRNLVARGIIPQIKITPKLVRYRKSDLDRSLSKLTTGTAEKSEPLRIA
jgi:excisionase family DNA binding protein